MTFVSLNTEWLWDDSEPHEGQIIGTPDNPAVPTAKEYQLEAYAIAKTIEQLDADVVGLIEVENQAVVDTIASHLSDHWSVVFVKGRDSYTGQDVAILTRLQVLAGTASNLADYYGESKDGVVRKRPSKILGVGLQDKNKRIYVMVSHLISKRASNDKKRYAQADAIRKAMLDQYGKYHHYVVLGDLNDTPDSDPVLRVLGHWDDEVDLVQPADTTGEDADFSYIYQGKKELIDHILVDQALGEGGVFYTQALPNFISDHRLVIFDAQWD